MFFAAIILPHVVCTRFVSDGLVSMYLEVPFTFTYVKQRTNWSAMNEMIHTLSVARSLQRENNNLHLLSNGALNTSAGIVVHCAV